LEASPSIRCSLEIWLDVCNEVDAEGRAAIVVAFRVDRQEDDGSLLILWKKLKKTSAPVLK